MPKPIGIALLFFSLLGFSQPKTPFVSHPFEQNIRYNIALKAYQEKGSPSTANALDSMAYLAYRHTDWDRAIDFYKVLVQKVPENGMYHFRLATAAARKSLEVARIFSIPYVVQAKKSILNAYEWYPKKVWVLKLLIQLHAEIPALLGGDFSLALEKVLELMEIDLLEGRLLQAYLFELKGDKDAAERQYFSVLSELEKAVLEQRILLSAVSQNLLFELGRAAAENNMALDLGAVALLRYLKTYRFEDIYPPAWAYYYLSKIYFYNNKRESAAQSITEALRIQPDFEEVLELKKRLRLE
jgi:tetratricopeptide (TPR) repeat protein